MTTIYLIRHGRTVQNEQKLVQGWSDSPLTTNGREVVKKTGQKLKDIHFDAIYTSDLSRTFETAAIILNENNNYSQQPIQQVFGLREACFGKYEKTSDDDMLQVVNKNLHIVPGDNAFTDPKRIIGFLDSIAHSDETNVAEDYGTFSKRVISTFKQICEKSEKNGDKCVLVVSHGAFIVVLLNELNHHVGELIENARITKITWDGTNFKVLSVNE